MFRNPGTKFSGRNREVALPGTVRFQPDTIEQRTTAGLDTFRALVSAAAVAGDSSAASLVGSTLSPAQRDALGTSLASLLGPTLTLSEGGGAGDASEATDYVQPGGRSATSAVSGASGDTLPLLASGGAPAREWRPHEYRGHRSLYSAQTVAAPAADGGAGDDPADAFCTGANSFIRVRPAAPPAHSQRSASFMLTGRDRAMASAGMHSCGSRLWTTTCPRPRSTHRRSPSTPPPRFG